MESLYTLEDELYSIFGQIEENGGELTEELASELEIKESELKAKLTSYKNAVQQWKSDIEAIKCETKRLAERKSILENRVERLKSSMLDAVLKFGNDGKSNNKVYELPDARLYTKCTTSTQINEERATILINCIREYIRKNCSSESFMELTAKINEIYRLYFDNQGEDFTENDIKTFEITISKSYNIPEILRSGLSKDIRDEHSIESSYKIEHTAKKDEIKTALSYGDDLTYASLQFKDSLIIK